MTFMINDFSFKSILKKIKGSNEIVFWSGAGISSNSGVPFVSYIIKSVIKSLSDDDYIAAAYYEKYEKSNLPFEVFMQVIIQLSNDDQVLEVFERGNPNNNHKLISLLCKNGLVKEIFTTNFDTLFERSFEEIGLNENNEFFVFNNEVSFKKGLHKLNSKNSKINLFKIHGSINDKKTIRTSIDAIANKKWMNERSKIIKRAFCGDTQKVLIVLGYSFSDVFDINPVIESIKNNTSQTIYIVSHKSGLIEPEIEDLTNHSVFRYFSKSEGSIISVDTNFFINKVADTFGIKLSDQKKQSIVWENKIKKWANRLLPSQKEYLQAQLFVLIHEVDNALEWNGRALSVAQKLNYSKNEIEILLQKVSMLHQKGGNQNIEFAKIIIKKALRKSIDLRFFSGISRSLDLSALIAMYNEDDFLKAKKLYLASQKFKEKIGDVKDQAKVLLSIASCLRHEQRHLEAIETIKKSIFLRNKIGDIGGIAKCFQGLGNVYLDLGEYKVARRNFLKFENITLKTGDAWSNAIANYELAEVNYCLGSNKELEKALCYCEKSIELRKHSISREFVNSIYLKAKILYRLGLIEEAKQLHEKVYLLRLDMPNKSDFADSLFDIGVIEVSEKKYSAGFAKLENALDIYSSKSYTIKLNQIKKYLFGILLILDPDEVLKAKYLIDKIYTQIN